MKIRSSHFIILIKVTLLIAVFVFVYVKIQKQESSAQVLIGLMKDSLFAHRYLYVLVVALMPLNWSLEAFKWQLLTHKVQIISFRQAFAGVLAGLSLGFISPHGLGDYAGRILQIDNAKRGRLVGSLLLGRMSQLFITVICGLVGIGYLYGSEMLLILLSIIISLSVALVLLLKTIWSTLFDVSNTPK